MDVTKRDREIIRELAWCVAEIAALPIQAERAKLWKRLNTCQPYRPMVLADPQGGWRELVPEAELKCEEPLLRDWELDLRKIIFRHKYIHDDYPVTNLLNVSWIIEVGDYGVHEMQFRADPLGSYTWEAPIKGTDDLKKLRPRNISIDKERSILHMELAKDIVGDILEIRMLGENLCRCRLTRDLIHLRGLEQMMIDMIIEPQMMHELMTFLRDDKLREWEIYEKEGVLSLNNGPDNLLGSGSIAYINELPAPDFKGHVRMKDMWCWGESQESVGIGPEHFYEFVLKYQFPLMERFSLVDYGCCEPLDNKFDLLIDNIPQLRWVSVSPWCNRELAAEKLTDKYVYVYKPNPSRICVDTPDYDGAEKDIRETLEIAKDCCVAIVMKDTHTFQNQPERITRWTDMASRVVRETL